MEAEKYCNKCVGGENKDKGRRGEKKNGGGENGTVTYASKRRSHRKMGRGVHIK